MYGRIVVATDSSDSANRAIEQAVDLADVFEAELYGISVLDTRYGDLMLVNCLGRAPRDSAFLFSIDLDGSVPAGFLR